jgi:hypothetical protein
VLEEKWYHPFGWVKPTTAEGWAEEIASQIYAPRSEQDFFAKVLRTFERQIRDEYSERSEDEESIPVPAG